MTVALLATFSAASAQTAEIEAALRAMAEQNLVASQAEDVDAIAATIHPLSPGYHQSLAAAKQINAIYDLRYRLLSFRFVVIDGEFAYARVEQETRKYEGPEFADNVSTWLWVFRQDGADWKLWSQALLEVDYFIPSIRGPQTNERIRLDFPVVEIIAGWLDAQLVECGEVPGFEPVENGETICLGEPDTSYPVVDDDLLLQAIGNQENIEEWTEVEHGHLVEFTREGVNYSFLHRSDGYSVIIASR